MKEREDSIKGSRVLVGVVQMLLAAGVELGLDRAELLAAASVREEDLEDRDAYLPFAKHVALGQAIIGSRPGVSVAMASLRHASPARLGVLGYLVTHARTLSDALAAFIRFQRLVTDGFLFRVEDEVRIVVESDASFARLGHPVEAIVGLWVSLGRALTGKAWSPESISFRHRARPDAREIEQFFGRKPRFSAPLDELRLSRETLALPVVLGKAALSASLVQLAEARLVEVEGGASVAARLRRLMFAELPRGTTGRDELAASLGMSARTLNRRLSDEGTTFRDVLDETRRELAEAWLGDRSHAIYEIAFLLGYSEPSTFHRSFRRWTGLSPRAFRRALPA
jgi:AraC-like DNA-binding protein